MAVLALTALILLPAYVRLVSEVISVISTSMNALLKSMVLYLILAIITENALMALMPFLVIVNQDGQVFCAISISMSVLVIFVRMESVLMVLMGILVDVPLETQVIYAKQILMTVY